MSTIVIRIACDVELRVPLESLKEFQGNLKSLSTVNYEKLKKSIVKHGLTMPFHVWEDPETGFLNLMDGHQRKRTLLQMKQEGFEIGDVPIVKVQAANWKDAKQILLSMVSQYGKLERQSLYEYITEAEIGMEELSGSFDIPEMSLDFEKFEEEFFKDTDTAAAEEEEVPVVKNSYVQPGQLFELGNHRLLCGDATKLDAYDKLMGGQKIQMVWTDPPYNVSYVGKTKDALTIENDAMNDKEFYQFLYDMYTCLLMHSDPGAAIYVAHADSEGANFRQALKNAGWLLKQCLIWVKQSLVMGRQDYHWKHEPILYGWAPGASHKWYSDRKQTTVLEFNRPSRNAEHPTMKPVELVEYCLKNSSQKQDHVLDPFGGSGTTLIACEKNNRKCFTLELDPVYCTVIIERYILFTGKEVYLLDGNERIPYSQIKDQTQREKHVDEVVNPGA